MSTGGSKKGRSVALGLALVVYYHLLRLPLLRWLESADRSSRWVKPVDAPPEDQLARLGAGGTEATSVLGWSSSIASSPTWKRCSGN